MDRLKAQNFRNTEWIKIDGKHDALVANDPHALVTIAGYLKYVYAKDYSQGVFFRGQSKIYGSLRPSLYRGFETQGARDRRELALKELLGEIKASAGIFASFGEYAHGPLIQHYGISTTWVDLVDNVWVALWFACNQAIMSGKNRENMHFEQRIPSSNHDYAFILLVAADIDRRNRLKPGYYFGSNTELVDLRMATPSIFLRPHAQHGLLFRERGSSPSGRAKDYNNCVCGVIAVELSKALTWLGDGRMVSTHSLFPPPYYDLGYDILLRLELEKGTGLGSVVHFGA